MSEALERAVLARREDMDAARRAAQQCCARLPSLEALAEAWRSAGVPGARRAGLGGRASSAPGPAACVAGGGDGVLPRPPADRSFMRRHARRGRAGPRANLAGRERRAGDLSELNFGRATAWSEEERRAFAVYEVGEGGRGPAAVLSTSLFGASPRSRMCYLSRRERNRLKHAENGNPPKKAAKVGRRGATVQDVEAHRRLVRGA